MHKTLNRIKSAVISGAITAVTLAGSFAPVAAPSLNTSAANSDYARLLQYSLYFFDANMCGKDVDSCSAMSWRGNCHTDDAVPGGYHDAGDHAMFGLPQGFAASTLGWSYYEFADAYDSTGQTEHLKLITDRFCDFFRRSAKLNGDSVSEFLYQKGDGGADHGYWGPPEHQPGGRKMFWTGSTGGDIAAEYAAALAVNYINFGNADDLKYAKAYYNYAKSHNSVVTDGPAGFYDNGGAGDEIAWAAGWLYLATKDGQYKNEVGNYNHYLGWVHGWESVDVGAACLEAEINSNWGSTGSYIASKASGSNYVCLDDWGSCRLNTSLQFTALIATKHGAANLGDWCKGQMNYILGQNQFNTCFVTGFASNSAKNVHHRAASGYEGYNPPDGMNEGTTTYHPSKSHVLIGALTGGPNKAGQYSDVMNDYQCNEVAIDYNACLVGAAAGLCSLYDKGGKTDSSIEGVTKIYSGGGQPSTQPTTQDTQPTTQQTQPTTQGWDQPTTQPTTQQTTPPSGNSDKVLTPSDMKVGQEKGDDGETNNYAEFAPQGAKSATLYIKVKSNDTEVSGGFGTWTGTWEQEDFKGVKVGSDKVAAVDYTIPAVTGQTIKAMVWWPHGDNVEIEKVVLHFDDVVQTQPTTQQTQPTTQQTQPTQQPSNNIKYGDANCDGRVSIADATAILQSIVNDKKYGLSAQGEANADVDGNKGVTPNDAFVIQQVDAGFYRESDLPL